MVQKLKINLGKKIKELRRAKNLTQEQFAELIGAQPQSISILESGRSFLSAERLSKICEVLKVTPKNIFDFDVKFDTIASSSKIYDKIIILLKNMDDKDLDFILNIVNNYNKLKN